MTRHEALTILELREDATENDIKKAYKKQSKTAHPDVGGSKEAFQKISDAYNTLTKGEDEQPTMEEFIRRSGFGFSGFNNFRHEQQHIPTLNLTLEEAFNGGVINRNVPSLKTCTQCNGAGRTGSPCTECNGSGQKMSRNGNMLFSQTCHRCGGFGKVDKCPTCNGSGTINSSDDIKVTIPKYTFGTGHARNELSNSINIINVTITNTSKEYILHMGSLIYKPEVDLVDVINGYTINIFSEEFSIEPFMFETKIFNDKIVYQPIVNVSNKEKFTEFVKTIMG